MIYFYLQGTMVSQQRHEQILGVLYDQEQHSTPTHHIAREEEAHVEQEGFEDDSEEEEEEVAPQGGGQQ
jgi:hypothetical protein